MIIQDIIRESVDKLMSLTMSVKQETNQDSGLRELEISDEGWARPIVWTDGSPT